MDGNAGAAAAPRGASRFFWISGWVMAAIFVAGFLMQFLMGRSTFAARLLVHIHAITFFGWVAIFLAQLWLVRAGDMARHRQLGNIAALWMVLMVVVAFVLIVDVVRLGRTPFFFMPQHFLVLNPLGMVAVAGLTAAAIAMRGRSDWHKRLHVSALALLLGPALGRLLPSPLLIPYAFEAAAILGCVFIVAGMVRDWRASGRSHPAWWVGLGVCAAWLVIGNLIAFSPLGAALYQAATAGSAGATIPGLAFGPPPPMP
jgi:hypothetical protein